MTIPSAVLERVTIEQLRKLDALVATDVLGLLICDSPASLDLPARCSLFGVAHYSADLTHSDHGEGLPRYSTEIAAAWLLVEHMLNGHAFGVSVSCTHESGWCATVELSDGRRLEGFGLSAPIAVCHAAIEYALNTPKKYGTEYGTENHSTPRHSL